jgi:carboxypeptidase Taq
VTPLDALGRELRDLLGEIADLESAAGLLGWDERTKMPPAGGAARAEQHATLARVIHERLGSDRLGRLLDDARSRLDGGDEDGASAVVAVARREWEKARRVPGALRADLARAESLSEQAWAEARAKSSFALLRPHLERLLELKRLYIECFEVEHPYDALLDDFEPEARTGEVRATLERLRDGIVPLVERIAAQPELDDSCLYGDFPLDAQRRLAGELAAMLPLPAGGWRLDDTAHPFAESIARTDIRLTTRYDPGYLGTAVWSVIHEAGHGLYEAGMPADLARTPAGRPRSLSLHESQSRLWENWVGRGRPFMTALHPLLAAHFPERMEAVSVDELYGAANVVRPSLIRVEADEVTYNLHIVIRFELELELFEGRLGVSDLPEAWRARYFKYLGLEVPDDATGVLQDVHWPSGAFGYFPTYSLGNVIAAQLWERVRSEIGDLDDRLAAADLEPLYAWLGERLFRHAGKLPAAATVERVLGTSIDPTPLVAHLAAKYGELYRIDAAVA